MIEKVAIGFGIVVLILGWLAAMHARDHVKSHGLHKITFRALTGRRTDGKRHTNASFLRGSDGKVTGHAVGRVSSRHHRAGISNLIRTLLWVTGILVSIWGATQDWFLTVIGDGIVLTAFLAVAGIRGIISLRRWYSGRQLISPLADGMAGIIGITGPEVEDLIHIEPDYLTKKHGVIGRIDLPTRFNATPAEIESIRHLVTTRLPVGADLVPRMAGRAPHILIHAAPALPKLVRFADYADDIRSLKPGQYLAGVTRSGDGHIVAFDGEDPHHGYCWGSGRGKTTILKSILAQTFHNEPDATATILDPKEVSLEALKGVPGINFYDQIDDFEGPRIAQITPDNYEDYMPNMWHGTKAAYNLMKRRYSILKNDPTAEFPAHYLVLEEANSFAIMSSIWWKKNKPKGMTAVTPPIWAEYVAPIFWRGRQVNIKIILVAQTIQERFLGNLNLRPSLGVISMSGYKSNQWMNYIGTTPVPKAQAGKGRAIYAVGESETWVQTLLGSDDELRAFAMANRTGKKFPVYGEVESIPNPRAADRESVTLYLPNGGEQ
jgi:hypothetical protein